MDEQEFLALNEEQRKAFQRELQSQKLYFGPIDGLSGNGMRTALSTAKAAKADSENTAATRAAQERADALKAKELELKAQEIQQAGKTSDVSNAFEMARAMRREAYDKDANSTLGMGAKIAAGPGALMGGKALGLGLGAGMNAYMNQGQRDRNVTLARAAEDRVKGLTTREGAITGAKLAGAMPLGSSTSRATARMAPHIGLGALALGTGAELLGNVDPDQPFYPRMADRAFGLANIGAGSGLITQGIKQAAQPGVSPDAAALSIINSNQLRRNNQSASPEIEKAMTPRQELVAQARAAGIKNTSRMNMTSIGEALSQVKTPKLPPGTAGAGLAAAMAYGMTPDRAEAADGSGLGGPSSEALTNAAAAGGATYGTSKIVDALAPTVGKAMGMTGEVMAPSVIDAMTDYSQEDKNMGRNWLARNLPEALQFGAVNDAREMAQVPTPSPRRPAPGNPEYPLSGPMPNAEAIPVPYPDLVSAMSRNAPAQAAPPPPMLSRQLIEAMMQGR